MLAPPLSAVGVPAALIAACFSTAGCSTPADRVASRLVIGITSGPSNLDPRFGLDDISQKLHPLIFDGLLVVDDDLRMSGWLAERFEHPTPTTYVAGLRRGVRFHDGHELTSADVAFTYRSLLDPALGSPRRGGYKELARVDALDRYTVQFTLTAPYTSFPINLLQPIVPDGAGPELSEHPNGTGPYRFVAHVSDDHVELAPFSAYWHGAPHNDGLLLKVVPDEVMRALEVRKGAMDLVLNDVSPDIYFQLRQDPGIQTATGPGVDVQYIGLNFRDPILRDLRVRRAIAHAIDQQAIVDHLRRGLAVPAVGLLPPQSWAFEPDVRTYPHDPALAKALLDEAGYPDPDGDGPLPRFHLSLKVSNVEFNRLHASVIQENLRQVGIGLDVRMYEFTTLFADVLGGNFQLYTLQWTAASLADPDILRRVFHSSQVPPAGFNRGGYSNPALDAVLHAAAASQDDRERRELYSRAQRLVADDLPYIMIWSKTNFAIAQRELSGIRINALADLMFLKDVARTRAVASK